MEMSDRGDKPDERELPPAQVDDPDAPPSTDEVVASKRLRDALEGLTSPTDPEPDDVKLAKALHAAWSPEPLDPNVHSEVLEDLPTREELVLAAELRDALPKGGFGAKADLADPRVALLLSLRSAWRPAALGEEEHRAIV